MTESNAIELLNKEFPRPSDNILRIMSAAIQGQFEKKEALNILVNTTEFLNPLLFILFTNDTDLYEVISYKEYADLMKQKALKSNNSALLNLAKAALVIAEESKL